MIKSVMLVVRHLIYGGTERYVLNLANALADRGVSVILVTSGGSLTVHISSKVKIFTMPISRKHRIKQITERRIQEIAADYRPQIIHTQCRTSLISVQFARNSLNIPVITSEHHMYEPPDYPFIVNELRNCADKIITTGPYTAKELIKNGLEKETVVTIVNGIDIRKIVPVTDEERQSARKFFNFSQSDQVVVCLSRIEQGKGIDKLALGFVDVVKRLPQAKLIIAGDDEWNLVKPAIKKIMSDNNLQDRCFVFPGEYDIRKYHAVADVFCYPAIAKGMAVMEAMAAGLPVVGKKTVRKPLVVENNVSGLMTEPTSRYSIDPDQIAEKLTFLLTRPQLAKKMGQAARLRIEKRFNLDDVIKKTLKIYQQVIKVNEVLHRKKPVGLSVVTRNYLLSTLET